MEATIALSLFDKILNIIGLVKEGKLQRDEQIDSALNQTHKALIETQAYVHRAGIDNRDPDKESELANLWYQASIPLRHVDQELANICNLKGGYWSHSEAWKNLESDEYDIALSNVEKKVRAILNGN